MNFLRSLLFYIFFYVGTASFFIIFSPVRFFSFKLVVNLCYFWTTSVIKLSKAMLNIDYKIIGMKNIPRSGAFIVASNHQSAWETFFFGSLFPGSVFILKNELRKIPIFSQYFKRLGFIFVRRDQAFESLKYVLKSVKKLVQQKRNVFIIFPEGTRLDPGTRVKLNKGVFAIHKFIGLPILPVKLDSGKFWLNKRFRKESGTIKIKIFPIIKDRMKKEEVIRTLERCYYK